MNLHLFDVHTHVHFAAFEKDYREAIKRALDSGVKMITVGTQQDTSRRAVEVANEFEGVWAAVGLHPVHTEKSYHDPKELGGGAGFTSRGEDFDYEYYKKLAMDLKAVAIGECGLDYYRLATSDQRLATSIKEKQKNAFIKQIELAKELNKPLMIHCRSSKGTNDAYEESLEILNANRYTLNAIFHFYAGSLAMAKKLAEAGFYFTFGGVITFARDYDDVIKYLPLERIMLETDAPYVVPAPYRGKRNEPAYVVEVAKKLAELKSVSVEEVARVTNSTVQKVFGIHTTL